MLWRPCITEIFLCVSLFFLPNGNGAWVRFRSLIKNWLLKCRGYVMIKGRQNVSVSPALELRCSGSGQVGEGWRHIFCLLFVQMLGILVDTGKLFQTKPEPSLRELGGPIQHCSIGYRWAAPDITDECQAKSWASFLSKLFIELQPYGHCWLGCMVKKLERRTCSQSWLCKFVLGKICKANISACKLYSARLWLLASLHLVALEVQQRQSKQIN